MLTSPASPGLTKLLTALGAPDARVEKLRPSRSTARRRARNSPTATRTGAGRRRRGHGSGEQGAIPSRGRRPPGLRRPAPAMASVRPTQHHAAYGCVTMRKDGIGELTLRG